MKKQWGISLVLLLVLLAGVFAIAIFIQKTSFCGFSNLSNENISVAVDDTPWKIYKHETIHPGDFILYYPGSWGLEVKDDESSFVLDLTNGSSSIGIVQGPGSVGWCLFPDDIKDSEPPLFSSSYTDYEEFIKQDGIVWRMVSRIEGDYTSIGICEKDANKVNDKFGEYFLGETSIGYFKISTPNPITSELELIKEIISKVEIVR